MSVVKVIQGNYVEKSTLHCGSKSKFCCQLAKQHFCITNKLFKGDKK